MYNRLVYANNRCIEGNTKLVVLTN